MFIFGIVFYFILMLVVGFYSHKRIHTPEDYLVANRKLPFQFAVPAIVATWFGAGTCLGVSGMVYTNGIGAVIADPFATSAGLIIAGLFFAYRFRKLRLLTSAEILGKTYGKPLEIFGGILMLPLFIGTLASQMLAMGYVFNITLGLPAEVGISLGSSVVLLYTFFGGMWAVTLTDFIQVIFIFLLLLILFFVTLGSFSDMGPIAETFIAELETLKPQRLSLDGLLAYSGQFLMTGLGAIMGQDLIQRFLSCKTPSIAKYSSLSAGLIYFIFGCIPIFIGLAGRFLYPNLENPETLIPLLASQKLSSIFFSIFAIGLVSAVMSTADSYLLAGTSIMTENILFNFFPSLKKAHYLFFTKIFNIVMVLIAFALAMISESIFKLMVHSSATLFVAIFVPVTAALYWKKARFYPICGWCAMLLGLASWLFWIFYRYNDPYLSQEEVLFAAATVGGAMSAVGFIAPLVIRPMLSILRKAFLPQKIFTQVKNIVKNP